MDQGVDALAQFVPDALPIQTFVDKDRDDQRVDDRDSSGLGGSEHTAAHPADAGIGKGNQLFTEAVGAHQHAHGDKERDSQGIET